MKNYIYAKKEDPIEDRKAPYTGLPMKGVIFSAGKMKYPAAHQPKINGNRVRLRLESVTTGEGMFAKTTMAPVMRSFEGIELNMPHITKLFTENMFKYAGLEMVYDGELYCVGDTIADIKSRISYKTAKGNWSVASKDTTKLAFWMFDLAIPNMIQLYRLEMLDDLLCKHFNVPNCIEYKTVPTVYNSKGELKDQKELADYTLVHVTGILVNNDAEATKHTELCLTENYEGGIIRNLNYHYEFGCKGQAFFKQKKWKHCECEILEVIDKGFKNGRNYVCMYLRNNINDEMFEANVEGDEEQRCEYLTNSAKYIGKMATIRYRERSGKAKVPFQSVVEVVDRAETGDL